MPAISCFRTVIRGAIIAPRLAIAEGFMDAAQARYTAAVTLAGVQAAHAFLDLAEEAPDGTVYLQGLELARSVLAQADTVMAGTSGQPEFIIARERLRERLSAISQRVAKAA
jgi:hypothetical protein